MWKSDFNKLYKGDTDPEKFVESFTNEDSFSKWLNLGDKQDIINILYVFEKHEMYRICSIIIKHMKEKYK